MSLTGTLRTTKRKVENAMTPATYAQGDMDILTKLKKEHREVQLLLDQLVDSESAAERKSLLKQIKAALVPHSRAARATACAWLPEDTAHTPRVSSSAPSDERAL